mmetsp:Transcript_972/g.3745  ORF Transcript_972/g.3745 Transcript_972/m.3745 type:complete len:354 (+) Transcript_972:605-1666(+)
MRSYRLLWKCMYDDVRRSPCWISAISLCPKKDFLGRRGSRLSSSLPTMAKYWAALPCKGRSFGSVAHPSSWHDGGSSADGWDGDGLSSSTGTSLLVPGLSSTSTWYVSFMACTRCETSLERIFAWPHLLLLSFPFFFSFGMSCSSSKDEDAIPPKAAAIAPVSRGSIFFFFSFDRMRGSTSASTLHFGTSPSLLPSTATSSELSRFLLPFPVRTSRFDVDVRSMLSSSVGVGGRSFVSRCIGSYDRSTRMGCILPKQRSKVETHRVVSWPMPKPNPRSHEKRWERGRGECEEVGNETWKVGTPNGGRRRWNGIAKDVAVGKRGTSGWTSERDGEVDRMDRLRRRGTLLLGDER